ncbi:MAG: hypothetical protein Q8P11_00660 [bacterium]|nr:hypothetical protein [bacterium]
MEQLPSGAVPVVNLPGMGSLLGRTWVTYKRLMSPLVSLSICIGIVFLIALGLTSLLNFLVLHSSQTIKSFIEVINTLIQFASYFGYALIFTAMLHVVKHRNESILTIKQALEQAKPVYLSLLWISILGGLATYGSSITIVLPILMVVWLYFGVYILVGEGKRGIEAIAYSRYITRGVWFATLGRYVGLVGIIFAISLIILLFLAVPVIGGVLFALLFGAYMILVIPFFVIFDYIRYEDLVALPRNQEFHYFKGEKHSLIFFAIVGLVIGIFVWISSLLTCQARTNLANLFKGGVVSILLPIAQNAALNVDGLFTFLPKIVYTFTPDICPTSADDLQRILQGSNTTVPSSLDNQPASSLDTLNLQPAGGLQDVNSGYPIQTP